MNINNVSFPGIFDNYNPSLVYTKTLYYQL